MTDESDADAMDQQQRPNNDTIGEPLESMFDRCFVINLARDTAKMRDMAERLDGLGLKYERFDAILGRELDDSTLQRELTPWCRTFCPAATVGCALSHKAVWRLIVERGLKNGVVFEDDCIFDPSFKTTVESALKSLPSDWDLLYLGCSGGCYRNPDEDASVLDRALTACAGRSIEPLELVSESLYRPSMPLTAHAYAISNKGARALLERIPLVSFHIDTIMAQHAPEMRVYAVHPSVVSQDTSSSGMASFKPALVARAASELKLGKVGQNLGWTLSEPVAQLSGEPINSWHLLLFLSGVLVGSCLRRSQSAVALLVLSIYFVLEAIFEYRRTGRGGGGVASSIVFLLFFIVGYGLGVGIESGVCRTIKLVRDR